MSVVYCPIDGSVITDVPDAGRGEVDAAFQRAQAGFEQWQAMSATARGDILIAITQLMRARAEEFAQAETLNIGAPLAVTRRMTDRAAGTFSYFGGYADKLLGTVIPVDNAFHTYTRREPHGVVVAIVPWNAPLIFATKKLGPALAFGNACILKPAAESPLTALLLAEVMAEAGMPDGVAQIVTGGRETGEALVADPRADFIVFTGFHTTGQAIAQAAAANVTPVALELGGKSPQIVFADADLERAVTGVLGGIFAMTGQACIAGSRVLVEDAIYDTFVAELAQRTSAITVGDPREAGVQVGPQATSRQRDKSLAMIEQARRDGATVAAVADMPSDDRLSGGYFVPPTVFTNADPLSQIAREEVFGPVVVVSRFADEADAVRAANDTPFGLAAGIWTRDVHKAHRVAARVRAGTVWVNTYDVISDLVPFGGIGLSGYGREGGTSAVEMYTRVKSVWTSLVDGIPPELGL